MYTREETDIITLLSFNLSYNINRRLLSDLESSSPDFEIHKDFLIKTLSDGVYNKVKCKFSDPDYRRGVLDGLEKKGIKCVTYFSVEYPEALKNITDPPLLLYCKGDTNLLKSKCFSVVGSRKSTPRILEDCKKISGEISAGFTVVSGLAEGADSFALEGALEAGGKVISVLANGFDHIYPATNAQLFKRIENRGLLVSEYPPQVKPKPYYFPFRNRIIAGLSRGTLVVSASRKSGALITADYALEYGRDVFAFPYYRGTPCGEGCNNLIKSGARLVENILDIFDAFSLDFNTPEKATLSEEEQAVFDIIKNSDEAFLPFIAQKLGKPVYELNVIISSLEIKGCVARLGGNRYCIKN